MLEMILIVTTTDENTKVEITLVDEVTGKTKFSFAEDDTLLRAEDLIDTLRRQPLASDGTAGEWETVTDFTAIDLKGVTAKKLYDAQNEPFCRIAVTAEITGELPDDTVNAKDAAEILMYAAKVGTDSDPTYYRGRDAELEKYAFFLADVNNDGVNNAKDANAILIYAAQSGTGITPDWDAIIEEKSKK